MIPALLVCVLLQATQTPASTTPPSTQAAGQRVPVADLAGVRRIYVDSFGEDAKSKEMQSMIVSALVSSKRFIVTENREHADAILKGVATEKTSQELHATKESTIAASAARGAAISDSSVSTETIDQARVAVRLVNADGDVIWTTTQESKGAKYKGASADAADLCVKQLLRDVARIENKPTAEPAAATRP